MDLFENTYEENIIMDPVVTFVFGILVAGVVITIGVIADVCAKPEALFQRPEVDEDSFQAFLAERMATSQAFRYKVIDGLTRLHSEHPEIYAGVMRKQ